MYFDAIVDIACFADKYTHREMMNYGVENILNTEHWPSSEKRY